LEKGYSYENVDGDSFATTDYGSLHDFPVSDPIHRNLYYRSCRSTDILLNVIKEIRNRYSRNLLRRKNVQLCCTAVNQIHTYRKVCLYIYGLIAIMALLGPSLKIYRP
jgi:hypothetical protein